jgi:hypothetical protein
VQIRSTQDSDPGNSQEQRLAIRQPSMGSARRWNIWAQQAAAGKQPCFASEVRFNCRELDCPWRAECLDLRAEWQR